jgi:hypothetical protein
VGRAVLRDLQNYSKIKKDLKEIVVQIPGKREF